MAVSSWLLPLLIAAFTAAILFAIQSRRTSVKDPYGSFHLGLNADGSPDDKPSTEWLNMGYWKVRRPSEVHEAVRDSFVNTTGYRTVSEGLRGYVIVPNLLVSTAYNLCK